MERQLFGSVPCGETDVTYYLLVEEPRGTTAEETEVVTAEENWAITQYGVMVEKGEEQVVLPSLDCNQDRVRDLLAAMVRGVVTPVSAKDIAEDWLLSLWGSPG